MPHPLLVDSPCPGVRLFTLNRPQALNALNDALLAALADAITQAADDPGVHALVIAGSHRVFAAGADIHEMAGRDMLGMLEDPRVSHWQRIANCSKPVIAAVNGLALGAGCELAMHADVIIAGHNARFGQPEINLGIMPGAGGTQRLIRAVGKSLAMQMVLTGQPIDARQAQAAGLVSEVTQMELTLERALEIAQAIAAKAPVAVRLAKEALLKAMDVDLASGLRFERQAFALLAATADRTEGIRAFQEKRPAVFNGH